MFEVEYWRKAGERRARRWRFQKQRKRRHSVGRDSVVNAAALDATIPVLRAAAPEVLLLVAGTLITEPL